MSAACFVASCGQLFQKIKERNDAEKANLLSNPIKITLPDGTVREGLSHKTTPFDIAMGNGLARKAHAEKLTRAGVTP